MKLGRLHVMLLLCVLMATVLIAQNPEHTPIMIGNAKLALGMPREAVLGVLKTNSNYLLTQMKDSRWIVSDKEAERAVAILTFDKPGKLVRVQKNWTPPSDSAMDFAEALYKLTEQMPTENSGGKPRSCVLSTWNKAYVGPYAWVRDPGQPDVQVRQIELECGTDTILIYVGQTTDVTRHSAVGPVIERALLYQSIGAASNQDR